MKTIILTTVLLSLGFGFAHSLSEREPLLFTQSKNTYDVRGEVDLCGTTLRFPIGCTIRFHKNGSIKNGIIVGNGTILKAYQYYQRIFEDVIIKGDWIVDRIYSNWFDLAEGKNNTQQIRNAFALCSDDVVNDVFLKDGEYWIDGYDVVNDSPTVIRIPSNTHIHNEATLCSIAGSHKQSFLFYFYNVSDCSWEGGTIIGDLDSHMSEEGEQGFGLALRGARNILISSVECRDCWGDGINLQYAGAGIHNENVIIENVSCVRNRRQGLSIEDGINITIRNSKFCNTGIVRGHAPMFGIDIEPCYENAKIQHIHITDCIFEDNKGGGVNCSFLKSTDEDIRIENCLDKGGGLRFNGCSIDCLSTGVLVSGYHCELGKLRFKRNVQNVAISDSEFMSALNETANKDTISALYLKNVVFVTSESRTWNFYCLSLVCAITDNVHFEDCCFEVKDGSSLSAVFPPGGDWSGITINKCIIVEHRDKPVFVPCDVVNSTFDIQNVVSFINHKKQGALRFEGNELYIRNPISSSPFLFMDAPSQDYLIQRNSICYYGRIDEKNLIVRHKNNKGQPSVLIGSNSFIQCRN